MKYEEPEDFYQLDYVDVCHVSYYGEYPLQYIGHPVEVIESMFDLDNFFALELSNLLEYYVCKLLAQTTPLPEYFGGPKRVEYVEVEPEDDEDDVVEERTPAVDAYVSSVEGLLHHMLKDYGWVHIDLATMAVIPFKVQDAKGDRLIIRRTPG